MNIKVITDFKELDPQIWSQYVYNHPQGTIFQSPEYFHLYKTYNNYEPLLVACFDNDKICGILSAMILKEYSGLAGKITARSIVTGGPLIQSEDNNILNLILDTYDRKIKQEVIYSQFRNLHDVSWTKGAFEIKGYLFEDHLNYLSDLSQGQDMVWSGLHPTRKKQINRSYRRGLSCEIGADLNTTQLKNIYIILQEVYRHAKLPLPDFSFFKNAYDQLNSKSLLKIFIARYGDNLVGSRWVLCYKDTIYDWYAGSRYEDYDKYPNDVLPWEVMKWGAQNGYKRFDFGGAGKPDQSYGVRDYKEKFGGELVNYGRMKKVYKPVLMKFAESGFKVWQKLKGL